MKRVGSIILVILIVFFIVIGYRYIDYRVKNAVSDAAFIRSDSLYTLGFKVGGKVISLTKKEGDEVKKGELLARIDPKDFIVAKKELQKKIDSLKMRVNSLKIKKESSSKELEKNIELSKIDILKLKNMEKSLNYEIESNKDILKKLIKDEKRFARLYKQDLVAKERLEDIQTKKDRLENIINAQKERLKSLKEDIKKVEKNIDILHIKKESLKSIDKEIESILENIKALKVKIEDLNNKISYTFLYSPVDGKVAKKFINMQKVVKKGSPIYSVVNPEDLHIEVLLSEKKLKGVKEGNSVKIEVDAYKDREYKGVVQKILPASAATFSLVPRDIASGEFTKLDQRFVVRIKILNPTNDLRVGMGASVAIERK